jgi:hypothetical protein
VGDSVGGLAVGGQGLEGVGVGGRDCDPDPIAGAGACSTPTPSTPAAWSPPAAPATSSTSPRSAGKRSGRNPRDAATPQDPPRPTSRRNHPPRQSPRKRAVPAHVAGRRRARSGQHSQRQCTPERGGRRGPSVPGNPVLAPREDRAPPPFGDGRPAVRWSARGASHTRQGPPSSCMARGSAEAGAGSRSNPGKGDRRTRSR